MFGKNKVAGRRTLEQGFLVHSIFYTIQGEGPCAGLPSIFVRFAECNLRCFFCDTDFQGGKEYTLSELTQKLWQWARESHCSRFVFTGGEPLLQETFLLAHTMQMQWVANGAIWQDPAMERPLFQFETAGTVWPDFPSQKDLDEGIYSAFEEQELVIVCSPKTGAVHPKIADWCSHWKYIVRWDELSPHDGLPMMSTQRAGTALQIYRPKDKDHWDLNTIWVQPCDETPPGLTPDTTVSQRNMNAAVKSAMQFGYRLSLQLHKIAGLE